MATSGAFCNHGHWGKGCPNPAKAACDYASVTNNSQDITEILSQKDEQAKKVTMCLTCYERDDKSTFSFKKKRRPKEGVCTLDVNSS